MSHAFTPDAAALGGPDWLAARASPAAERLADVDVAHRRRGDLALLAGSTSSTSSATGRSPPTSSARPASSRRPAAGPFGAEPASMRRSWSCATAGWCTTSSTPTLEAKGVTRVRHRDVRGRTVEPWLGTCADASPDAFTVLHDAFLAGGAFVHVPAGVVVERPIVVLHWSEGDGRASFPHTLVVAGEAPRSRCSSRYASAPRPTTSSTPSSSWWSATARTSGTVACRSTARARGRSRCSGRTSAATRRCGRRRSRSAATTRGCAPRRVLDGPGAESDLLAVYFGDGDQMLDFRTLQDHDAPAHPQRPARSRARSRTRPAPCTRGLDPPPARRPRRSRRTRPTATSCSPRAPARSRSRTSRSRPTTCGARTRRRSARSTTTSATTSRPAACRPRRPSGSSCSASSRTCFARLPVRALAAPLRRAVVEKIEPPPRTVRA